MITIDNSLGFLIWKQSLPYFSGIVATRDSSSQNSLSLGPLNARIKTQQNYASLLTNSVELYLIRHGIAADRLDYNQDAERPLTRKGEIKTQQVALQLQNRGLVVDAILSSPLRRAQQTAQILLTAGLSHHLETHDTLAPGGLLQDWLNWLKASPYNQADNKLALVGHQPDLGAWAESLVWGQFQDKLILKKAGLIGLTFSSQAEPLGNAQMFLLVSPRWLL